MHSVETLGGGTPFVTTKTVPSWHPFSDGLTDTKITAIFFSCYLSLHFHKLNKLRQGVPQKEKSEDRLHLVTGVSVLYCDDVCCLWKYATIVNFAGIL